MLTKSTRKSAYIKIFVLFSFCTLLMGGFYDNLSPVAAISDSFLENFTTTTFMNDISTTANGWGTGTLNLPPLQPYRISALNTTNHVWGVETDGDFLYAALGEDGIAVYDICTVIVGIK